MTKPEQLAIITKARAILESSYVPWFADNGHGGHCHMGALSLAIIQGCSVMNAEPLLLIDGVARRMHPELSGATATRPECIGMMDSFDRHPGIYVNNQLGKAAILAVYDEAINQLEVAILCEQEEARLAEANKESDHATK